MSRILELSGFFNMRNECGGDELFLNKFTFTMEQMDGLFDVEGINMEVRVRD